jgi:hypothetical protein
MIKSLIFLTFVLILFSSCSKKPVNCKISPDLEKIGESAVENLENLSETNLKSGKMRCDF